MLVAVAALAAVVALLVVALYRQQVNHLTQLQVIFAKGEQERRSLLDRIQHPQVRQVDHAELVAPDVPRDAAEFAQVGSIVPEFVHVGTDEVMDG